MTEEIWTLLKLLQWTSDYFRKNEIENPRLNVEYLLGKVTNLSRVELYINFERIMSKQELEEFRGLVKRRISGEPLQYILGETNFYGFPIRLNKDVLIPRPETELLVEKVVSDLKHREPGVLVDLGTGSGCIAIALASLLPDWKIIATDISEKALKVAQENSDLNNLNSQIHFIQADARKKILPGDTLVDVIVSNPPYVTIEEFSTLSSEIKNYEPEIALHDGGDGLGFYRLILEQGPKYFKNKIGYIYFELGHQSLRNGVWELAEKFGFINNEVLPDYSGIDRILKVTYDEKNK